MPTCNLSTSNPLLNVNHSTHFIVVHHNVQSLHGHIEDVRANTELRKGHVICLSETWLTADSDNNSLQIDGYDLIVPQHLGRQGRGRGVAMYVQRSCRL